ncbi:response regulator [Rhodopila sp.]|uniref:response regulator n=1 Tax=Rhodopila sp. TaxID=2480087 RepID=UPI003D13B300
MTERILVVEDEYLIRLWIAECLLEDGFDVVLATNGDHALGLIAQPGGFDLLITDIAMPGLADGNAVATAAKQRNQGLPVIYVSGRPDSVKNQIGPRDGFIAKPYSFVALSAMARRLLDAPTDAPTDAPANLTSCVAA